jgi:hypothetical protein
LQRTRRHLRDNHPSQSLPQRRDIFRTIQLRELPSRSPPEKGQLFGTGAVPP